MVVQQVESQLVDEFQAYGYSIARGLFTREEAANFAQYFTDMVERGGDGWAETEVDPNHEDPLRRYPRLLQPHRGDKVAFDFMIDPRVRAHLTEMAGADPYAVQTMVYFKPPQSRGQALHQDNMFLLVEPGTCLAAWLALDDCDEENGCMMLVPGTKDLPIICQREVTEAVKQDQWGGAETPLPPGANAVPAVMQAGDVLFFNGSVIHGSYRNRSETRFRRIMVGHYIAAETKQVAKYYFPVFRMDGTVLEDIAESAPGGPCGVYEGDRVVLSGHFKTWEAAH